MLVRNSDFAVICLLTTSFAYHFSEAKTDFVNSYPFQSGQNQIPIFQSSPVSQKPASAIPILSRPAKKPTSVIPIYYSQSKTNFNHSNPFRAFYNQLPQFQTIPVSQKSTSAIPIHYSQSKINFAHEIHHIQSQTLFKSNPLHSVLLQIKSIAFSNSSNQSHSSKYKITIFKSNEERSAAVSNVLRRVER
jgi:hypothetical protein